MRIDFMGRLKTMPHAKAARGAEGEEVKGKRYEGGLQRIGRSPNGQVFNVGRKKQNVEQAEGEFNHLWEAK